MCCEKCTNHGISTPYGRKIYEQTPPDERWRNAMYNCIKMTDHPPRYKEKDRVLWGTCRATQDLNWVECCRSCDFFS